MYRHWPTAIIAASLGLLSFGVGSTHAQMPTPTPYPDQQNGFHVSGTAWIDAMPAPFETQVQALINGVVCGEGQVLFTTGSVPLWFSLAVAPRAEKSGCGIDGATVTFTIDGKPAHQTLKWNDEKSEIVDLSAGEPFAAYSGPMSIQGKPVTDYRFPDGSSLGDPIVVDAFVMGSPIESVICGQVTVGGTGFSTAWSSSYRYLIVPSAAQKPGCGEEGVEVRFRIAGAVVADTKWTPGFHEFSLETNAVIVRVSPNPPPGSSSSEPSVPNVGEGQFDTAPWRALSIGLLFSGLFAVSAAAGLSILSRRKKA